MIATKAVSIRPVTEFDHDRVQRLWESCGMSRAAADEWAALTAGETSAVLVCEDEGEIVGAAIASFDGWRAYIYHVAVDERRRREGIAFDLVGHAEQYLLSAGARNVHVMVAQENTEGLALVGSLGYLPEGEIVLVKRLATRV